MNGAISLTVKAEQVPLRIGPPTKCELLFHYPPKFTWHQLKTFINSGDLGLLKRDKKLQDRYDDWARGIAMEHGSMVNYLLNHRLQWGKPDTLSLISSTIVDKTKFTESADDACGDDTSPPYFSCETPAKYVSIIQNDWPYSVPLDVEHTLIWTKVPIFHPDLVHESIKARVDQDGLWGFTGSDTPPPSPSNIGSCIPSLADWGVTMDKLIRSSPPTLEEAMLIKKAGREVHRYVQNRWSETGWETAWFVNPPRLQSVPGLAHIHVFARWNPAGGFHSA